MLLSPNQIYLTESIPLYQKSHLVRFRDRNSPEEAESPITSTPRGLWSVNKWSVREHKLSDKRIPFLDWKQTHYCYPDDPWEK